MQFTSQVSYDAFESDVTSADIASFRAKGGKNPESAWIALIVIFAFLSLMFLIVAVVNLLSEAFQGGVSLYDLKKIYPAIIVGVVLVIPIIPLWFLNKYAGIGHMKDQVRLNRFAHENGFQHSQYATKYKFDGLIFNVGFQRQYSNIFISQGDQKIIFGVYDYSTGIGRSQSSNTWKFVTVKTDKQFPHVVFDAKGNNGKILTKEIFSSLPQRFSGTTQILVSPEVDALFHVYAAEVNGEEVAKLFTAEVIEKITALKESYDIEFIGNRIYFYGLNERKATRQATAEAMDIVALIGDAFGSETLTLSTSGKGEITEPRLKGREPKYLKVLAVFTVTIQFIALIALIISHNQ